MRTLPSFVAPVIAAALLAPLNGQSESSEAPPPGAPWTKSFTDAHRLALEAGRPIFVYSTKTH